MVGVPILESIAQYRAVRIDDSLVKSNRSWHLHRRTIILQTARASAIENLPAQSGDRRSMRSVHRTVASPQRKCNQSVNKLYPDVVQSSSNQHRKETHLCERIEQMGWIKYVIGDIRGDNRDSQKHPSLDHRSDLCQAEKLDLPE